MINQPFKIASNISIPGSVLDKLSVSGNISSTRVIYASGGNSDRWNSTYATVSSLSANTILAGGNSKGADILIGTNDAFNLNLETANETRMTITSTGDVGIGTTTPAYKLTVNGGIYISASNSLNLDTASSGIKTITASGNDVVIGGGAHIISGYGLWARGTRSTGIDAVGPGGDLQLTTAGAEKVRVTTTGNVGIGTTSPSNKLDVIGNAFIGDSTTAGSALAVNTGAGSVNKNGLSIVNSPAATFTALSLQSNWSDGNGGNLVKIFNAAGDKFVINNTGNVGIGTTTPAYPLSIGTNAGGTGSDFTVQTSAGAAKLILSSQSVYMAFGANPQTSTTNGVPPGASFGSLSNAGRTTVGSLLASAGGATYINFSTNGAQTGLHVTHNFGSDLMTVLSNGNVGIGTTTPNEKLTVTGNISSTNVIYAAGGNSNLWNSTYATVSSLSANNILDGGNTKGANITIGTTDNFNLNLETANTTRMTVTSAGSVGIGTTSPSYLLDVKKAGGTGVIIGSFGDTSNSSRISFRPFNTSIEAFVAGAFGTTMQFNGGGFSVIDSGNTGNTLFSFDGSGLHVKTITSSSILGAIYNQFKITSNWYPSDDVTNPAINFTVYNSAGSSDQLSKLQIYNGDNGKVVLNPSAGNVGIGTTTPNARLTVAGVISSTNIVYASGGNSDQWNSAFASVNSISANGSNTYTTVNANSANWNSTYTTVCAASANWNSIYSESPTFVIGVEQGTSQGDIVVKTKGDPTGEDFALTNLGIFGSPKFASLTVSGIISSGGIMYAPGGNSNLWNQNTSALYQATSGQFAVKNANNFFSASQSLTGDLIVKGIISVDKGDGTPLQEVATKNFSIAMAIALS
jgi:hypothetical protein